MNDRFHDRLGKVAKQIKGEPLHVVQIDGSVKTIPGVLVLDLLVELMEWRVGRSEGFKPDFEEHFEALVNAAPGQAAPVPVLSALARGVSVEMTT